MVLKKKQIRLLPYYKKTRVFLSIKFLIFLFQRKNFLLKSKMILFIKRNIEMRTKNFDQNNENKSNN